MSSNANTETAGQRPAVPFVTPGRVAVLTSILALIPYLFTLSPTYGFIDKGELVAVASTLGIAPVRF